jgi:putative ABC transport system permease protein
MRALDSFNTALANLLRNRIRTALSLLGIAIGVFAVTIILSLGAGMQAFVEDQLSVFGRNYVQVSPKVPGVGTGDSISASMTGQPLSSLKNADLFALERAGFPYITAVNGVASTLGYLAGDNGEDFRAMVVGVRYNYQQIDAATRVESGRFFTMGEESSYASVAVIGSDVSEKLFYGDPLGRKLRVRGVTATVVGVLESRGPLGPINMDEIVLLPLGVVQKKLSSVDYVTEMHVKIDSEANLDRAVADITRFLRRQHGIVDPGKDDFTVTTAVEIQDQVTTVLSAITYLLGFLAAISLLVGGIGIMTIMLVAVTERVREIGLRKALGALSRDIMGQFIFESIILTSVGGAIGGSLAVAAATALVYAANVYGGYELPYVVSWAALAGGVAVSAAVGLIFGLYPARKAAAYDPIVALRFE